MVFTFISDFVPLFGQLQASTQDNRHGHWPWWGFRRALELWSFWQSGAFLGPFLGLRAGGGRGVDASLHAAEEGIHHGDELKTDQKMVAQIGRCENGHGVGCRSMLLPLFFPFELMHHQDSIVPSFLLSLSLAVTYKPSADAEPSL